MILDQKYCPTINHNIPGYLVTTNEYQATRRKIVGVFREIQKTKQKQTRAQVAGQVNEGTRLLFAGRTVNLLMCPADGQQKRETSQEETRDKKPKSNCRPQQGSEFSLKLFCPGVVR